MSEFVQAGRLQGLPGEGVNVPSRANIIEGLKIAEKYDPGAWIDAQHDVIYALCDDPDSPKVSAEDRARLEELGFHWDDEVDSWAAFT